MNRVADGRDDWGLVLVWALMLASCMADSGERAVELEALPGLCPPIGIGGGEGWATSCDRGAVVNTDTGETHELNCQHATHRAEAQDIIAVRSDAVVVFSCLGDLDKATTTMVQSLVEHPGTSPVDMGFPAFDLGAAAYSAGAGGGSIVMLTGTCDGLLVYRLDATDSLTGETSPVSMISLNGNEYELDGGSEFGDGPPCAELAAVRGLGSSPDGSTFALAVVGPDEAFIFDRPADVFAGSIDLETSEGGLTLTGDMEQMADDLDELYSGIGVAECTEGSKLLASDGSDRLSVLSADQIEELKLPAEMNWGGLALSDDGRSLLVLTDVPFEPGELHRSDDLDLC